MESEECLKRYLVTVADVSGSAFRAILVGKVEARTHLTVSEELAVLALRASVMRRKRIDLRNTRHGRDEGRADRASRSDQVTLALAIRDELLAKGITLLDTREGTKFTVV